MIQITPHIKIMLAVEPVDFRKGIDGLSRLCRTVEITPEKIWIHFKNLEIREKTLPYRCVMR